MRAAPLALSTRQAGRGCQCVERRPVEREGKHLPELCLAVPGDWCVTDSVCVCYTVCWLGGGTAV